MSLFTSRASCLTSTDSSGSLLRKTPLRLEFERESNASVPMDCSSATPQTTSYHLDGTGELDRIVRAVLWPTGQPHRTIASLGRGL